MAFPVFPRLLMSSKICNNASNEGLSHYFSKKMLTFGKGKILKIKKLLLNGVNIKDNVDVIILIT